MQFRKLIRSFVIIFIVLGGTARSNGQWLQTPAEQTEYQNGGTLYSPLMEFVYELESRSDLMNIVHVTETLMGRDIVLCILSDPPVFKPDDVVNSGKPIVLIVNNVHGGEVAGKDASMEIMRNLVMGDLRPLLKEVVVLNIPTINPDGAELRRRTNVQSLDMNRDYIKLESREIHGLVTKVINRWHPDIHIDTHHGGSAPYTLTYQTCMNPAGDPELIQYGNEIFLSRIREALRAEDYDGFWYAGPGTVDGVDGWTPTSVEPRKQHVYSTLSNIIGFLFETPSNTYRVVNNGSKVVPIPSPERYRHQVRGQYLGQREVIRTASENAQEVKDLIKQAESRAVMLGNNDSDGDRVPVSYKQETKFEENFWRRIDWKERSETRGDEAEFEYVRGPVFTRFTPVETTVRPWGYLIEPGLANVTSLLLDHNISVKRLTETASIDVETYYAQEITHPAYFQGHYLKRVKTRKRTEHRVFPAGTFFVPSGQPKSNLISYILEPETNDNLITWGYLDNYLRVTSPVGQQDIRQESGRQSTDFRNQRIPIYRLMKKTNFKSLLVQRHNKHEEN